MAGAYEKLQNALMSDKDFPWLREIASALSKSDKEAGTVDRMLADDKVLAGDVVRSAFQRMIIDKMSRPRPVTVDDLVTVAQEQLSGVSFDEPGDEWIGAANRFVVRALAMLGPDCSSRSGPPLAMGVWACEPGEADVHEPWEFEDEEILWSLDDPHFEDWNIELETAYDIVFGRFNVTASFHAPCTERAMQRMNDEAGHIVKSIAHTVALSATSSERAAEFWPEPDYVPPDLQSLPEEVRVGRYTWISRDDYLRQFESLKTTGNKFDLTSLCEALDIDVPAIVVEKLSDSPKLSFLSRDDGHRVFNDCWDAYLDGEDNGDEFDRRIRNAVILLAESDRIRSPAIRLALCFSAIEALCCKDSKDKKAEISIQIKKYLPLLMCPPHSGRSGRGTVLFDLYEVRSRILHGSNIKAAQEFSDIARRISAGALRAVTHWRFCRRKAGLGRDWSELIGQLDDLAFKTGSTIPETLDLSELLPKRLPLD